MRIGLTIAILALIAASIVAMSGTDVAETRSIIGTQEYLCQAGTEGCDLDIGQGTLLCQAGSEGCD